MPRQFTPDREDRVKLYEIREDIEAALTPEPDEPFNPETLAALDLKFDDKVSACVAFIKNLRAHRKAIKAERERLEAKEKTATADEKSLIAYVLSNMQQAERQEAGQGMHKVKTGTFTAELATQANQMPPDYDYNQLSYTRITYAD